MIPPIEQAKQYFHKLCLENVDLERVHIKLLQYNKKCGII